MSADDVRLAALQKDVSVQDIIEKLDETNRLLTMLQEALGIRGRDIKYLINQFQIIDSRLAGLTNEP